MKGAIARFQLSGIHLAPADRIQVLADIFQL